MRRNIDRTFKLSRLFKRFPALMRWVQWHEYGEGVPGWLGWYDFCGRCVGFQGDDESIVWLHEVL